MAAILAVAAASSSAQWVSYRDPATPRTPDGKPNLTAAPPRAANGKPDLSGVWQVEPSPADEMKRLYGDLSALSVLGDDPRSMSKYVFNIFADFPRGEEPMRPEAARILRERAQGGERIYPRRYACPAGCL